MFLFLFLLEIHRDKNSLLLSRKLCCCSVWLVRIKGILAEVITAPVREGTAFPVGYANTSPDWSVWYCWSLSVTDMPVASQETWESFLCLFSAWMQRWVRRLLGIVKFCRTCDALPSQEGTWGVLRALPGTQDVQILCLHEESTQEPKGRALRNLTVPLAGEYLAGMDKEPLFPQHLNLAKKTALTDKSLPTGQREIAKPAHTVKSSVPSVNSEKPQLLPIMCAAGPSGSLRGHPDLLWKWKPCQPQAVPVLVLPGAMLCSVRFLFPALEPSISKQCCLVDLVSHPQRSGSAVMWPQLCCDDTLLT